LSYYALFTFIYQITFIHIQQAPSDLAVRQLEHHFEMDENFLPNCPSNHIPAFFFSTRTIFMRLTHSFLIVIFLYIDHLSKLLKIVQHAKQIGSITIFTSQNYFIKRKETPSRHTQNSE